jgi:outer membrane protein assembly factor BamB
MKISRFLLIGLVSLPSLVRAEDGNWPEFRGPRGDGTSTSTGLPLKWSTTENVKWHTPIHGRAWSSPVIWGEQIWLTTATEDGRELSVLCLDKETGKTVWDKKLFDVEKPQFAHKFNSYASPTPAIEDGRAYITFGSPGTACLDTKTGEVLWQRRDIECNHYRGAGSSPILWKNLLIVNYDGSDVQFVMAFDKQTGKTAWKTNRSIDFRDLDKNGKVEAEGDFRKAYSTCQIAEIDGHPVLLSQGAKAMYAYDPATGEDLWRVEERSTQGVGVRPLYAHGLVYTTTGWTRSHLMAIHPGKKGEVLDVEAKALDGLQLKVEWMTTRGTPKKPSPTIVGDLIFVVDDSGVASCWKAKTGEAVWNERLGGNFSASPLAADGRLYFCNEEGKTVVVPSDGHFEKLAENELPGGFMASPAVSGKALFLRTKTELWRIGE